MRVSYQAFLAKLQAYLSESFTERVEEWNTGEEESVADTPLDDIAEWGNGYISVLQGCQSYPACILLPSGRRASSEPPFFTQYKVTVGIALTGQDFEYLVRQGQAWEDILEDTIRSDWSLGGACLDSRMTGDLTADCTGDVYVISCELECTLDIGGAVYDG